MALWHLARKVKEIWHMGRKIKEIWFMGRCIYRSIPNPEEGAEVTDYDTQDATEEVGTEVREDTPDNDTTEQVDTAFGESDE